MHSSGKVSGGNFPVRRPLFYYITDRRNLSGTSLEKRIRRAVEWGVDFVQIREKDLNDSELFELARRSVEIARGRRTRVLINGRADVALAARADGVHLPASGPAAAPVRSWTPKRFLIGVSAHSLTDARRAAGEGADYVLLSPVFWTESKARYGPPLGLPLFRRACARLSIPIIGLGGIGRENICNVILAGAAGVAGISLFQKDPGIFDIPRREVVRRLRRLQNKDR